MVEHVIYNDFKYIVVSSKDTDVLVLMASHFNNISCNELWMMAGTKKNPKNIPVHDIVKCIHQQVLGYLIPFNTLTGCDTTLFIANHTKTSAWTNLLSHSHLIRNLGVHPFARI